VSSKEPPSSLTHSRYTYTNTHTVAFSDIIT
jgi:hypothetical protein